MLANPNRGLQTSINHSRPRFLKTVYHEHPCFLSLQKRHGLPMQKEDSSEEISIDWDRVAPHFTRQGATLMRVHNLVCLYDRLIKEVDGENKEDKLDAGDILRSAVVLLHASLEDLVRTYAATFLTRDEELFKEVGLVGKPPNSRICLGDFVKHRNKSVDELLEESIHSWLHRSFTISSNRDLIDMLKRLKIDPRPFQANF